ncbi:sigma-70 family RNA polymerase sigma factor [Ponticaulis sp.]|uniref:RNA polymerase sigma factor n=1 Tax=Ponticaulis sp. TaxID=2020902 RepID=UPI000B63845B|nr:sigma-70 family RNA polymerase sigma factor [Ponticaulis sp.]MAI90888.1 hypothetical protein [Ponticaulis sp.]OUX98738.1 MAG: hypothetical protein CBB65_10625 [Hyphomonadaceae bacterium TMED5]|tara:strand:- start:38572 stop:39147 length:576 start_codon:yes stop_codon:yes gene_type:complete
MNVEDFELSEALTQCANREKHAFIKLYNLTSGLLYRLTRRIVKDDDLAQDVLQKGYLAIWRKAHHFDDEKGRALTWMMVIMRNHAIDEWRRQQRHAACEDICETIPDTAERPDVETDRSQIRRILEAELHRLPSRMAFVIHSRFLLGKTVREIADEMSISINTIKSWIRRGLKMLRDTLPFETAQVGLFME